MRKFFQLRWPTWARLEICRRCGVPVLARQFPLWTTPMAPPPYPAQVESAPPLLSGSNREGRRDVPPAMSSASSSISWLSANGVEAEWLSPMAEAFFATFAFPARTGSSIFAVRFSN